MSAEKIDDFFDANLNFCLDCKTCTMCNNDSKIFCVFVGPTFRASREAFRRLRENHIFLKFVLGPTWAPMTSQRKSISARGHFYVGYSAFFPALHFWWNSHHCHLGPAWGFALICRPRRYPFWGSRFRWKKTNEMFTLWGPKHPYIFLRSSDGPNLGPRAI